MLNRRNILILIVLVSALLVAYWGLSSCLGPKPEPTPTLTPTVPPATDDSWSRIQAAGKIVVGTSADYPPFEYYTGDFQVDGFDIALMREIGQRLGVGVEFQDFAFDGLGAALQIAQIDVVIAALSVTPEREALVDFSNVYYVGEDGVLARQDATISIGSAAEMAGQRVGMQRGSAYEDWLRSSLVDTGLMPASNLFAYIKPEDAVRDLKEDRVDLVVMDALPAQGFADQGGVKLVGRGLNQQRFAIAVGKGAASLKAEIDRALIELHNEGRVAQLAKQYLGLDPSDLLPTPTPTPPPGATVTPAPPPTCINGMAHVQDLTYDDKNMTAPPELAPGQPFVKSWRVRNSGTCLWDETYRLVYVTGNVPAARMGGEPVAVTRQVATNDTYDLHVNLVAPLTPGIYQGFWQMVNGNNVPFGQRIYVGIRVPGAPAATPAPTQTPSPGIEFSADHTRIRAGERVVFTWKVENVKAVYFYSQGAPWEENGVAGHDSREVWPPRTTVYELRVLHRDNRVEIREIRIEVEQVAGAPVINRFTVGPHQIEVGQCVDIQWEVQGSVDRVKLLRNNVAIWDGAPTSGTLQDCPPGAGEMSYLLEASGPGGTSRLQRAVSVVQPDPGPTATPIPTPPPGPAPPVIDAFAVSPNQIQEGECVNVSWSASGGTTWVQIKRNGVVVLDGAPLESAVQDCLDESGRVTYRVEASNSAGETVFQEATVTVTEAPPENPLANTNWQLAAMNVNQVPVPDSTITARFDAAGGLSGDGGCNSYDGVYTVSGASLGIIGLSATGMMCGDDLDQQEQFYLAALQSAAIFEISGNQLIIRDATGQEVLTFEPVPEISPY